ncbi:MAG: InlB B-repeat-containing protein [Clostridia bacterium]|nr:InlB B-repeat-containing protein [Clostridia bacterium]
MKRFIKTTCMCLVLTMLLSMFLGNKQVGTTCSGFFSYDKLYEDGDFIIKEDNELYDFSDQGLNKEYIVIPKGMTIRKTLGNLFASGHPIAFTYSEKIKKIYNAGFAMPSILSYNKTKEENIVFQNQEMLISKKQCKFFAIVESFYNYKCYQGVDLIVEYCLKNSNFYREYGYIVYAQLAKENSNYESFIECYYLANIEFMYNYENAPTKGYYWIDDLETGETLAYMPPNPTREGYTFDGWYADSECTIEYDFTTPYIKKEFVEMETEDAYYLVYPKDYVTHIYAKWI